MHREYAVEPITLSNWKDFRYIIEKFGWSKGRLISHYPKHWERLVRQNISKECFGVERLRIIEKLNNLTCLIRRNESKYDGKDSWLNNTLNESKRKPFEKIIALEKDSDNNVIASDSFDENDIPVKDGIVLRNSEKFSKSLSLLLQTAEKIILIDPYFDPTDIRCLNIFKAILSEVEHSIYKKNNVAYEIHTSLPKNSSEIYKKALTRISNCKQKLKPFFLDNNRTLKVVVIQEKLIGEEIHNRYILTDKAGVEIGHALAESSKQKSTDDIHKLSKNDYMVRWKQYSGSKAFEIIAEGKLP